ncbi:hypothetical protein [Curtobacterium sp. 20TX0008]|uniref:hypothetical protein n=1 Tax=Curtobacterium sp. 20TX0008 TaxID=3022018 RepID=UPI00232EB266|nr:hypothetical protein [Curtobacterium sp. 20TX0008]MDB6425896.1 hypothetical protein [Curtobacterium sp. 20TX0008]
MSWGKIPANWGDPDLDLLRQSVSRDLLADVGRISRQTTDAVLDRGLALPRCARGPWLVLSNAVRGWLAIGYQTERWLTESVSGVVLVDAIRDRGAGAAPLVLQRLVDELPPFFDPAELYRLPLPVPDRWDLEDEPGLVPASTPMMWQLLLRHRWVCDEAIAAAVDAPLDRVAELAVGTQQPSEVEVARLQILTAVYLEYITRADGATIDEWLLQRLSRWGSLAAHLMPWDPDSIAALRTHLPPRR